MSKVEMLVQSPFIARSWDYGGAERGCEIEFVLRQMPLPSSDGSDDDWDEAVITVALLQEVLAAETFIMMDVTDEVLH